MAHLKLMCYNDATRNLDCLKWCGTEMQKNKQILKCPVGNIITENEPSVLVISALLCTWKLLRLHLGVYMPQCAISFITATCNFLTVFVKFYGLSENRIVFCLILPVTWDLQLFAKDYTRPPVEFPYNAIILDYSAGSPSILHKIAPERKGGWLYIFLFRAHTPIKLNRWSNHLKM